MLDTRPSHNVAVIDEFVITHKIKHLIISDAHNCTRCVLLIVLIVQIDPATFCEAQNNPELSEMVDRIAYRPRELSEALGVSVSTIWVMIKSGEIKSFKFGGSRFVPKAEVDRLTSIDPR